MMARIIVCLAFLAGDIGTAAQSQQPQAGKAAARPNIVTATTVIAIGQWMHSVEDHHPGEADASVDSVLAMSPDARREFRKGLGLFLCGLTGVGPVVMSDAEYRVAEMGADTGNYFGANAFLDRAAVLHADAALATTGGPDTRALVFHYLAPRQPSSDATRDDHNPSASTPIAVTPDDVINPRRYPTPGPTASTGASTKPSELLAQATRNVTKAQGALFPTTQSVNTSDAEYGSVIDNNWNWTFARSLLDLVQPTAADDPFVATWYHATTAFMLAQGALGEARNQVEHAALVLPDDARVLFDRACVSEEMGLPLAQALLSDDDQLALRLKKAGTPMKNPLRVSPLAALAGIPLAEVANDEAESLFRRALEVDPTLVEARVRLARLIEARKGDAEADALLTTALEISRDPLVTFHAHLFAARADHALGKNDLAATHIRAALALFPNAQSALMAQSQLALFTADPTGALTPIRLLASMPADTDQRSDPWWLYHLGPGREADSLLAEMWAKVKR
jgi:tetratricopeptide (TPR) repeat protein